MSDEENKTTKNIDYTESRSENVPLIVVNDIEIENKNLKKEVEYWKSRYDRLFQELNLLLNPEIFKEALLKNPYEDFSIAKELIIYQNISKTNILLPNGIEGKEYSFELDVVKLGLDKLQSFELKGLESCGLNFDKTKNKIWGTPTSFGDFKIILIYKLIDFDDGKPKLEKIIPLVINPDPRSLWKSFPSDKNDKYWKPDNAHEHLNIEQGHVVVASQRGRSHAQEGKFRDDHFSVYYNEISKWTLVIVADGAGSAKYSRRGSTLACEVITEHFKKISEDQYQEIENAIKKFENEKDAFKSPLKALLYTHLAAAAHSAYKVIEQEANSTNNLLKDFGTTIAFSIFKKFEFGWFISTFGVGDSPIGVYTHGEKPIIMHYPEEGEFSGQTYFLTMPEIFKDSLTLAGRISVEIIPKFAAILLMTDGIYDPKFQTKTNLENSEFWKQLWKDLNDHIDFSRESIEISTQLLNWLDFWSPGNHDDRTLAIIYESYG